MKKSILNLGKALNKAEQKQVNGGNSGRSLLSNGGSGFYCSTICSHSELIPLMIIHLYMW